MSLSMKLLAPGLIGLLFTVSCDSAAPVTTAPVVVQARSSAEEPLELSLIQLIARPSDFDGEYVRVKGFYRHEFEGNALYLHREDYEQGLVRNGLWMNGKPEHNMKYVLIEGRFNAKKHGHMGMWSGEIEAVTRIESWPPNDTTAKD